MERLIELLKLAKTYFLIIVIAVLGVIIYFKNIKIENLNEKISEKPKVELIYNHQIDTIKEDVPVPVEVVKWKPGKIDTTYLPSELNFKDTVSIAEAYSKLYTNYNSIKKYDDVLKDDSLAYIRLKESTQHNSIFDRELIYEHRTPTVYITQPPKYIYTTSIVGGIEAGSTGVEVGAGLVTKRNAIYKISYDPFNQAVRGAVYLPIFNFK